jgi:hypothetical protein
LVYNKQMNKNIWGIILVAIVAVVIILKPYLSKSLESFQSGGNQNLDYSAYFTPWWRQYYSSPIYGTSATALDNTVLNWPFMNYYNYYSYWRRPQYYNYWRKPYFYKRPVSRPYVRDSIMGRRARLRRFDFENDKLLQENGSYSYGTFRDYY